MGSTSTCGSEEKLEHVADTCVAKHTSDNLHILTASTVTRVVLSYTIQKHTLATSPSGFAMSWFTASSKITHVFQHCAFLARQLPPNHNEVDTHLVNETCQSINLPTCALRPKQRNTRNHNSKHTLEETYLAPLSSLEFTRVSRCHY